MADWNRVTDKPHPKTNTLYLVTAEWRGGHDRKTIRVHNIFCEKTEALANWEQLTAKNHNKRYGLAPNFDAGFVRLPVRVFYEAD